jgi:hypothetical protein
MRSTINHSVAINSQSGAVLPIVAITALALLSAICILAIDTFMVKDAQRRLRTGIDTICRRIAPLAINQTKARAEFDRRIDELATQTGHSFLRRTHLREARLLIPTMPNNFIRSDSVTTDKIINDQTSSNGYTKSFTNDVWTAALDHNNKTRSPGSLFPISILSNDNNNNEPPQRALNAGMTVGCEVTAHIDRVFKFFSDSQSVPVKIKSLWWTPVRALLKHKPGLTIAIAPELNTNATSKLFRFDSTVTNSNGLLIDTYSDDFRSHFNPIERARDTNIDFASHAFQGGADQLYSSNQNIFLPKMKSRFLSSNALPPASGAASSLDDALSACSNPVVLLRNVITSTIVELASRHGQLRDSTEILLVNPQSAQESNPPAIITQYGEDIAKELFQIPYVLSKQRFDPSIDPQWGDPFSKESGEKFEHKLAFSEQLRMCYHLFDWQDQTSGGVSRYLLPKLIDELENDYDEPPLYQSSFRKMLRETRYLATSGEPLDQRSAWTKATLPGQIEDRLSAAQVVSALGSIQLCPTMAVYCPSPGPVNASCKSVCQKPTLSTNLDPDLDSLFRYLTRDPISESEKIKSGADGTKPTAFPAIVEPGIFPFNEDTKADPEVPFPLKTGSYHSAESLSSHILLVLHTLPNNLSLLKKFITSMSTGKDQPARPVTIIYIPASVTDASQGEISRLKAALNPVDNSGHALPQIIPPALFIIAPAGEKDTPLTETDLILYWHKLLTEEDDDDQDGESAVTIAQSIFTDRILRLELRY